MRKPTLEEYEDSGIINIELMVEAPSWDSFSHEFSQMEQSLLNYRRWFDDTITPARGLLFINSVTSYAFNAADVTDNEKFTTAVESCYYIFITSSTSIY